MKVEAHGHTNILKDTQGDLTAFIMKVSHEHKSFSDKNLVVDLSAHQSLTKKHLIEFTPLCRMHSKGKKSFVIVCENVNFTEMPKELVVVPTRQEALDLIEMDEIERDLGF
ncbi:ribonuclease Z [Flavobacterium aurantiibacter]|uniref:Ribonuclease Z n=1 Tax=Flavobacterium aurantiibacter TaxID=2023067 RepID=A0A255ZDR3_9FLAO|nr:ribonuclease Z [Flavobacterium aurantiibacter]OYQ39599.1 ribonuclease Z [Flavobacterium aurantiibacter]